MSTGVANKRRMRYYQTLLWLKSKHQEQTPNDGEDVQQHEPSLTAGGNVKCYAYFGKQAVS